MCSGLHRISLSLTLSISLSVYPHTLFSLPLSLSLSFSVFLAFSPSVPLPLFSPFPFSPFILSSNHPSIQQSPSAQPASPAQQTAGRATLHSFVLQGGDVFKAGRRDIPVLAGPFLLGSPGRVADGRNVEELVWLCDSPLVLACLCTFIPELSIGQVFVLLRMTQCYHVCVYAHLRDHPIRCAGIGAYLCVS